ncbi:O-antigen ligase family protein [Acanthopleuribacter pedis]|uniref:O-antigen ligase family protein n=1 Tax=Acanthopleuribacter pedis TaxID=442870 RepID=A0A8J7QNE3_9BACT|nr:O-antigen ligase family protein [Acanthopleuribacter pedis]MBO1321623.1 O-antigen ligase family protein [Acanthopleuribacter pedis]
MDKTVLLPIFISAALILSRGYSWAFCTFYIPLMVMVPTYLHYDGPGVPPITFYLAAFIPFLFQKQIMQAALDDFHWLDLFVYFYSFCVAMSELVNESLSSARQMVFLDAFYQIGPYLAMKWIVLRGKRGDKVVTQYVGVLVLVAVISLYEFRMGQNPFMRIRDIWPVYDTGMGGVFVYPRWGFFRIQGPFVHSIICALAYTMMWPMAMWAAQSGVYKSKFKGMAYVFWCWWGLMMTMSRGPMIGGYLAAGLYVMGQSKFRIQLFAAAAFFAALMSIPASFKISEYMSLTRETAKSESQETVIYRKDLIFNYVEKIQERPWLGYGFLNLPQVGDQKSIDNAYLLIGLNWGVGPVLAMLVLGLGSILAMAKVGFSSRTHEKPRKLCWALIGGIAGTHFTIATVYHAYPTNTMYFMWIGWAAALLTANKRGLLKKEVYEAELVPNEPSEEAEGDSPKQEGAPAKPTKEPSMVIL